MPDDAFDPRDQATWPPALMPEQVALILNVSPNHIYALCQQYREDIAAGRAPRGIPNVKLGRPVRIPRQVVIELLSLSNGSLPAVVQTSNTERGVKA